MMGVQMDDKHSPRGLQVEGSVLDTQLQHTITLFMSHNCLIPVSRRSPETQTRGFSTCAEDVADIPGPPHVIDLLLLSHMCKLIKHTLLSTHADPGSDVSCERVGEGDEVNLRGGLSGGRVGCRFLLQ